MVKNLNIQKYEMDYKLKLSLNEITKDSLAVVNGS